MKEYPSLTPDDIALLFSDVATPVGLILNHNDPRECCVIFSDPEYIPEICKLINTPPMGGTHMNLTLDKPRGEMILILAKLLEDKALEEFEYIPMEGVFTIFYPSEERGTCNSPIDRKY